MNMRLSPREPCGPYLVRTIHGKKARPIQKDGTLQRFLLGAPGLGPSVRNKLFGGFARSQPPLGRAEARMAEAFVFGVSAKRLAQRFVSGAWLCRMY